MAIIQTIRMRKTTRVRWFSTKAQLLAALKKSSGVAILDPGAQFAPKKMISRQIPPGESAKSWSQLEEVLEWLASRNVERGQTVFGIGGGACLDLTAFASSLYRRGTPLVLVPTTLLAMVDATLGGKTAVDRTSLSGRSKNFAGTFYPADEIWICLEFLKTLSEKDRWSGAGEVLKTLWLSGKKGNGSLIRFLRQGKVDTSFSKLIAHCLMVKKTFVEKDPFDQKRIRESLNYGHTIGHALETLAKGKISHGEAIWWGMAVESLLLKEKGKAMCKIACHDLANQKKALPREFLLPKEKWIEQFLADKKVSLGMISLTVLLAPGKRKKIRVSYEEIYDAIKAFREFYPHAYKHQQA
jgi:3-dehydroquinate synthetase